jgi:hypothetical protein
MPSKKKARSLARKAKKEEARQQAAASSSDIDIQNAHIKLPEDRPLGDFKEAIELFNDFRAKMSDYEDRVIAALAGAESGDQMLNLDDAREYGYRISLNTSEKSELLDDTNKNVFQQLLVLLGINMIKHAEENGVDFIELASSDTSEMRAFTIFFVPLMFLIDEIEQTKGHDITSYQLNHTLASPREFVRFFYRRSSCSCLKDLYYNLKDNTPKRTFCQGCKEMTDAKNIFECNCKRVFYCSRECAKLDWADHKNICEAYKAK